MLLNSHKLRKENGALDFYQNFRIVLETMNGLNALNLFRSINLKQNEKKENKFNERKRREKKTANFF